jgi:tetratricopeptide (TPR) repeat protein
VCRILGAYAEAQRLSEASLALSATLGPFWGVSPSNNLGVLARLEGHFEAARRRHEHSLAVCHAVGDVRGAANTTYFLAELELAAARLDTAEARLTDSLNSFQALHQRQGMSACLTGLAEVAIRRGDYALATDRARESLALAEAIAAQLTAGRALSSLGLALLRSGDQAGGCAALARAESIFATLGAHADAQLVAARRRECEA